MNSKTKQWFAFRNATDEEVEVYLYEEIGFWGATSKAFVEELNKHKGKHVHLRIDSPGGEVHAGNAIFNALRRHKGGVTVHIDGMAASMASVIAMAGNPICIADNAFLFVHNPWTVNAGDSGEMRKTAEQLDVIGNVLVGMYAQKTKLPVEEIQQMMDEETLLSATDAVALGFADMIEDGVPIAASMTPEKAKARFDKFMRGMDSTQNPEAEPATESLAVDLGQQLPDGTPVVPVPEVVEPVVEEVAEDPATEEVADEPETLPDMPQASVGAALADAVATLRAERDDYKAKLESAQAAWNAERTILQAEARQHAEDHDRLARSLGIVSASVIPELNTAAGDKPSLLEEYNAITDPAERSAFYRKHRAELVKLVTSAG